MQKSKSFTPEAVLRGYFHAKDENRPHLLEDVFASNAELFIRNQSANIAFPAFTQGRSAIAEVLVRSFALLNENVYSFYLAVPCWPFASSLALGWWACRSGLRATSESAAALTSGRSSRMLRTWRFGSSSPSKPCRFSPSRSPRECSPGCGR